MRRRALGRTALGIGATFSLIAAVLALSTPLAHANGCIAPAAGTGQDPFIIATPSNLDCLVTNSNYWRQGYHFRQTADLDMSGYPTWARGIGSVAIPFNGTYDGNGFAISNLTVSSPGNGVGMFGVVTGATLTDITVTGLQVTGDRYVGGLAGVLSGGSIERVSVSATVTGLCTNNAMDCGVGGIAGYVDDSGISSIAASQSQGSVTATYSIGSSTYGRGAGGLVGMSSPTSLAISDSYSVAQTSGYNYVGGAIGVHVESNGNEALTITDTFAAGPVTATQGSPNVGGLIGRFYDNFIFNQCDTPYGPVTVTDSYWDTQTTGQLTTAANRGTGKSTAQMKDLSTYSAWSISDTTPDANATWGLCSSLNSGYPFLQWAAQQQAWTCSAPNPPAPPAPAPVPATAPTSVQAVAGDTTAVVTWSPPPSSGSYAISTYLVTSTPDSRTCLTTTTGCTMTGLRNGVPYTFTVQALTGAGWSPASQPSPAVIPTPERIIVISGTRQGRSVAIQGATQGLSGEQLAVMTRVTGERSFAERGSVFPNSRGAFSWTTSTGKTLHVYVQGPDLRSNRITIPR